MIRTVCLLSIVLAVCPSFAQRPALRTSLPIAVEVDREDAIYGVGDTVTFTIKTTEGSKVAADAEVSWTVTKDGVPPIQSGKANLVNGAVTVTGKLDEPGFLLCRATATVGGKPVAALGGAAIAPTEIKPSMPIPADFDDFWAAQKKLLASVPLKSKLTPVEAPASEGVKVSTFDVQLDAVDAPVSGYFAKPADAKPQTLPVILTVHGAGVRSANLGGAVKWAQSGMLAMDINAHGIPNGQPAEFYTNLSTGTLRDYRIAGRDARETSYFLGMFLREVRALDFLCSQPEWDGKTVVVYGSSQGGYQAFAVGALDPRVTFFAAAVPAGCDHTGMVANRVAGWPKWVPVIDGKPDPKALEASRYFDNVNFAIRTKAKGAFVTIGFIDQTCPPTSVYAAFNALPIADKKIYHDIRSGHSNSPEASRAMADAVLAHVKAQADAAASR